MSLVLFDICVACCLINHQTYFTSYFVVHSADVGKFRGQAFSSNNPLMRHEITQEHILFATEAYEAMKDDKTSSLTAGFAKLTSKATKKLQEDAVQIVASLDTIVDVSTLS